MTSPNRPEDNKRAGSEAPEAWTFFRQWLKNPLAIAALSPSGRQLARQMIAELPHGAKRVVELGGGTGVFTRAMLTHGIDPKDLLVLELNEPLYQHLRARFPDVRVECGDARELKTIAARNGSVPRSESEGRDTSVVAAGMGVLSLVAPQASNAAGNPW